jgi:predicted RNA-binding Zn-ribbon protein involved in translation (DUF1610 family)
MNHITHNRDGNLIPNHHNLHYCGFECPRCGYHHLLSDIVAGAPLVDLFRDGDAPQTIYCPECGNNDSFVRTDLKLFGLRRDD